MYVALRVGERDRRPWSILAVASGCACFLCVCVSVLASVCLLIFRYSFVKTLGSQPFLFRKPAAQSVSLLIDMPTTVRDEFKLSCFFGAGVVGDVSTAFRLATFGGAGTLIATIPRLGCLPKTWSKKLGVHPSSPADYTTGQVGDLPGDEISGSCPLTHAAAVLWLVRAEVPSRCQSSKRRVGRQLADHAAYQSCT
ncbi:hypothetical protein B0T24DRAFT_33533 [Lasiosphaeria ovina]|uniref:Uncharacterized protein n=1 Tax=Lasiosphaeria ovina TaxID=92902 RepID=A0AAE0TXE1_9PEZI|nr:hypothetical protein B0T24DRAFT_33533 [Lasiosphaeria ovina]